MEQVYFFPDVSCQTFHSVVFLSPYVSTTHIQIIKEKHLQIIESDDLNTPKLQDLNVIPLQTGTVAF